MAFTTSVLLIPGEKYSTLTTSDSGWVYDIAVEIDNKNGFIDNNPLSHAPYGHPVGLSEQGQPLLAVMLYRTVHAVNSDVTLMDVVNYFGPLIFALTLIPVFLIGRELGGDLAGCAATFFFATLGSVSAWMGSPIYWCKFGAFDREPTQLILGVWAVYLAIRLYKAPPRSIPMFAALEGLVCGLALLTWPGMFYLVPIVVGGLLLCLLLGFFGKLIRGKKISEAASLTGDENSRLVVGVIGAMAVAALALYALGVADHQFWIGNIQTILSYVPISAGTMAILVAAAGVFFAYFFLRAREKTWGYAALAVVVLVCALGIYSLKTIPSGAGLPAPSERHAGEMRAPESWSEIIYGFYGEDILTKFVFFLVALAIVKVCLSRKRWELLVFPWLIILMGLVWPGVGMVRFERMWWPFVAVVAGLGAATLVSAIKWLSREPMTAEWAGLFKKPVVIALCFSLIPIPFVTNAYATARVTAAPTGPRLDDGFMDAFAWIRENTPEGSIFAIEWSYGHLFTGTARRATVCDGCETAGVLGEWENTTTTRPPDYIKDSAGNFLNSHWTINGRRTDVQYLPTLTADNELEFYLKTYRDNYGVRIDYVIFHAGQYDDAIFATRRGDVQNATTSPSAQDKKILYTFSDENVLFDPLLREAYVARDGENLYLAGVVMASFNQSGYLGQVLNYNLRPDPAIPRVLWILVPDWIAAPTWDQTHAQLTAPAVYGLPILMRVFEGRGTIPNFMEVVYTSSNGLVKVIQINHENLP